MIAHWHAPNPDLLSAVSDSIGVKRLLRYFGLVGDRQPRPWWWGLFEAGPPLFVGATVAWADGVTGVVGFALWVLYMSVAWTVWLPLIMRFAARWSGPD